MRPFRYRPARPLSRHERAVLAALACSLDAVPRMPGELRRAVRSGLLTLAVALVVVAVLIAVAVLLGVGGFELAVVALGTGLFGVTLRDLVRSTTA